MTLNKKTLNDIEEAANRAAIFEEMMGELDSNVYVTDVLTNRVVYMNRKMKETYGVEDPVGRYCFEVCQKGQSGPCDFCPVLKLKNGNGEKKVVWREVSSVNGHAYENYDRLMKWTDGRTVHIQQSIDITDAVMIIDDELCKMPDRRTGKQMLAKAVTEAKKNLTELVVTVIDINNLKETNDNFGHDAGDFVLYNASSVMKKYICGDDFVYRLGGDEFVAVFLNKSLKQAEVLMRLCLSEAGKLSDSLAKPYGFTFCFGMSALSDNREFTARELIARADEAMFSNKLRTRRKKIVKNNPFGQTDIAESPEFSYNALMLFDALTRSLEDKYIFYCNMKTGVFRYSPELVKLLDLPAENLKNPLPFWKNIIHPDDWYDFYKSNFDIIENKTIRSEGEFRTRTAQGVYTWMRFNGYLMRDENGQPHIFAGAIIKTGDLNNVDPVTGLYGEKEFARCFEQKLSESTVRTIAVMIFGMDNFWQINQLYDRQFGDAVLRAIGKTVKDVLPGNAALFSLDGDKFGIIYSNVCKEDMNRLYSTVRKALSEQQLLQRYKCALSASAGCALFPFDGDEYLELYKYADYALENAKIEGKNRLSFFSGKLRDKEERSLEILKFMRDSINCGFSDFHLVYQPQVDAESGEITGAEALLRWSCEKFGSVSPQEFIQILEENGYISKVGKWVLKNSLRESCAWIKAQPDFIISVNISFLQVLENDFVNEIHSIIEESGIPARNVMLELTENCMVGNISVLSDKFSELRSYGIKIAVDDFGTGYSSYGILKNAQVNRVKIDKVFTKDVSESSFDATFIRCVSDICHDSGIEVCLEGVERTAEYEMAKRLGVDCIQGYLFGRPQSPEDITRAVNEIALSA